MYTRGLISQNSTELAGAVPIAMAGDIVCSSDCSVVVQLYQEGQVSIFAPTHFVYPLSHGI